VDFGRAFTYAFEDPDAPGKLIVAAVIAFVGAVTLPLLLAGLVAYAALLGYLVLLIRNLRDGQAFPLPTWTDLGDKIGKGGSVLTAAIVYALPNLLVSCLLALTSGFWGDGLLGAGMMLLMVCCVTPLLLVYNLLTWAMLAVGIGRYAEEEKIIVFFQFGDLLDTLRRSPGLTVQWLLFTLLANLILGLLFIIPCIGWALAPALALPVQGYLIAAFTVRADAAPLPRR
jgi:uncharacterized membrane protein